MDTLEAIFNRRSVRKYEKGFIIPDEDIKTMLDAAMHAPSACNTRPWEFVVLKSDEAKKKAQQLHSHARHLDTASIAFLVCGKPENQGPVAEGFYPQDCAAATENILLAAHAMGYGTCWCGIYPREERVSAFKEAFSLNSLPFCLITVGKPSEEPQERGYYDESVVSVL